MTTQSGDEGANVQDVTATMHDVKEGLKYWPAPPPWGWTADDLDHLPSEGPNGEPDFFKHVELIDGALIFMSPQRLFHEKVVRRLTKALEDLLLDQAGVASQMDVRLGLRTRPCPDVLIVDLAAMSNERTSYLPSEVHLVVEVESPESVERDRLWKPQRYAQAGIPHFWRVEQEQRQPVIHTYELDRGMGTYAPTGIYRDKLGVKVPFPVEIDLTRLAC